MSNSQVHVDVNFALDVADKAIAAWDRGYDLRKQRLLSEYETALSKWNARHVVFRVLLFFAKPDDPRNGGFGSAWELTWWNGRRLCEEALSIRKAASSTGGKVVHITIDSHTWADLLRMAGL